MAKSKSTNKYALNVKHLNELTSKRQLDKEWVLANCKSVTKEEATELLGYSAQSGGIWLEGSNYQGQFKPDKPWATDQDKEDGKKKAPKYRSPQQYEGSYDCILVNHPEDPDYWSDLEKLKNLAWQINGEPYLLITEGIFKAIAACHCEIPTIALLGVEQGLTSSKLDVQGRRYLVKSLETLAKAGFNFIIGFDADCTFNKNVQIAQRKLGAQLKLFGCSVYTISGLWSVDNLYENGNKGIDDFLVNHGVEVFKNSILSRAITQELWWQRIEAEREEKSERVVEVEELYTQKAQDCLYTDTAYISVEGDLYRWAGTHYKKCIKEAELRRIANWCKSTPVQVEGRKWRYAYATSTHVGNIYNWVVSQFGVGKEEINPPGLNCLNGVLQIIWKGAKASWELQPHNPERLYTYVSEIEYSAAADDVDCNKLLSCLEPAQQKVFIQTLAASLDLATIRRYRGREVKALLLQGHGNNGKDSLREAVRLLYGGSLVGATIADFAAYDGGRKFPLAKLQGSLISWSSENTEFSQLDKLQSLKAAITGDPIYAEKKGEDEKEIFLNTVFLFSVNEAPTLRAGLEAIKSRWAVLRFNKTFKVNADPKRGEIEADSRFRYDPEFLKKRVVPALLNKMLEEIESLAIFGIDYKCTEDALESIQRETNHLWAFAQEVGLQYQVGGRIYINDLWQALRNWYLANGTLVITVDKNGKEKTEWYDQARSWDRNVKGANQVYQRFVELFPKAIKQVETVDFNRRGQSYLSGLAITASIASINEKSSITASIKNEPIEAVEKTEQPEINTFEAIEAIEAVFKPASPQPEEIKIIPPISPGKKRAPKEESTPPPFKPGDLVVNTFSPEEVLVVTACSEIYTQVKGKEFAIANWQLKLVDYSVKEKLIDQDTDTDS
jgi:phage/plasmid-associated DNA primase